MRWISTALLSALIFSASSHAGFLFPRGPEALKYGPYTGGHGYSYNTAYSYGFAFSAADTWRRDIFAYPGGINPYRPYGKPIKYRVFPNPTVPYVSVPGPDGMPILVREHPGLGGVEGITTTPVVNPHALPLQPVPAQPVATTQGTVVVSVPASAEVWVEKEKMAQSGESRMFRTPVMAPGDVQVYTIRARWEQAGKMVEQVRVVGVKGGETARVSFTAGSQ